MTLPNDPILPETNGVTDEAIRRRQKGRAIVMALALGALVILFYAISIAKMS